MIRGVLRRALVGFAILLIPGAIWSALHMQTAEARAQMGRGEAVAPAATPPNAHRMRCWQHGQLIFEETDIAPPAGGYSVQLKRVDNRGAVYIFDDRNVTCIVSGIQMPGRRAPE